MKTARCPQFVYEHYQKRRWRSRSVRPVPSFTFGCALKPAPRTTATSCTAEVKAGTYNTCPVRCLGLAITLMTPKTSASTRSIRLAHYVQLASGNLTVSLVVATS